MKDLIEMPTQGFIEGPIEGSMGILKGAGSLIQNTFTGAFSSVHSMSDALGF